MKQEHAEGIPELTALVDAFARQREWDQFHSPKNLSMAIAIEAAELMELFQWVDHASSGEVLVAKKPAIEHEVADVFAYLLRFCSIAKIDLALAVRAKLALNAEKYPVDKVRGKSAKYDEY